MRLFIAIELPKSVKAELSSVLRELKALSCGGRFVPEENTHITMHFIGESNDLNGAVESIREAVRGIRPFVLRLGGYDFFDKGGRKTSFVSVGGELAELRILHEALECALADRGFSRDFKRFTPHITLGRNVEHDELVTGELKAIALGSSVTVTGLTLFESVRANGRMVYMPLHRENF